MSPIYVPDLFGNFQERKDTIILAYFKLYAAIFSLKSIFQSHFNHSFLTLIPVHLPVYSSYTPIHSISKAMGVSPNTISRVNKIYQKRI